MDELREKLAAVERAHQTACNYAKTLELLAALKGGTVELEQVALQPGGWVLVEVKEGPTPNEAAVQPAA